VFRALGALGLVAVLTTAAAPDAGAINVWCRTDPIVQIDGQTADVFISSYEEMKLLAAGPTKVRVTVPPGVDTRLVATDQGFGGWGYEVSFAESAALKDRGDVLEVRIEVYAPALDAALPVRVAFTPRGTGRLAPGTAEGTANAWVSVQTG
jgi:hypothetical protein